MGSIVRNHPEYPEDEEGVHPSLRPQKAGLIAKKTPTKVPVKYADFADVFSPDLASELSEHAGVDDHVIELVDANEFIRPSKSPVDAPRQAGKGLILPEDFLLADASMVFHLQQCRHTICIRGTYLAVDNQAGRTLEWRPKGRFMAQSRRSRMSPSRSPPSIQIIPIFWHQRSRYRAGRMPTGPSNHPSHQEVLPCFSTGTSGNFFARIRWIWVDQIQRSRRSHVP